MTEVAVLIPSRGRPERFAKTIKSIIETSPDVGIYFGFDNDDRELQSYYKDTENYKKNNNVYGIISERSNLVQWTNELASLAIPILGVKYLVSMGDDHIPRTPNWDKILVDKIESMGGTGFAFGDDGTNGSGLCTSWMVSVDIVEALGWMMLPTLQHMYVDNVIMELGASLEILKYAPEVLIEHMHPTSGKSDWDDTYWSKGDPRKKQDLEAFRTWHHGLQFGRDQQTIRRLLNDKNN